MEAVTKCIELFGLCTDVSDNKEDVGIKKGGVEYGEEDKEREVHKKDKDGVEEV